METDKRNCNWCENRNYFYCKDCIGYSNFDSSITYEEWKRRRKQKAKENKADAKTKG